MRAGFTTGTTHLGFRSPTGAPRIGPREPDRTPAIVESRARGQWRVTDPLLRRYLLTIGPSLPDLIALRPGRDRELAVRVPAVRALCPRHRLAAAEGIAGVEGTRQGGHRVRSGAEGRGARRLRLAAVGTLSATGGPSALLELADRRHGNRLRRLLVRAVGVGMERVQRRAGRAGRAHGLTGSSYIGSSDFWEATFQNWQSEFLAVGSFAVLAIYLRQRGSPESKPVGASTSDATGAEG